jgi:hypothetical protein
MSIIEESPIVAALPPARDAGHTTEVSEDAVVAVSSAIVKTSTRSRTRIETEPGCIPQAKSRK